MLLNNLKWQMALISSQQGKSYLACWLTLTRR